MPELDGGTHPLGNALQEPPQPVVIALQVRRKLHEQRAAAPGELVQTGGHPLDPLLGTVQAASVRQAARRLHGEFEPPGQPLSP